MLLAQEDWRRNNFDHLHVLLAETQDYPERDFEWYYWQAQTHLEHRTLRTIGAAFATNGKRIVSGGDDGTIKLWEASSGRELLTLRGEPVYSVALSRDGQHVVTGNLYEANVWDVTSGQRLMNLKGGDMVGPVAISPDSERIVTCYSASKLGTAQVWESSTGRKLFTLEGHSGTFTSVAFSPDGQRIAAGSADKKARVWNAFSGLELLALTGHEGAINSVAFSPDGLRIISGSDDKTAIIWDAATGKALLNLKGHEDGVLSVAFSTDGKRIITGCKDHTVKVWQQAGDNLETHREAITLKGHGAGVNFVACSPEGEWIIRGVGAK
jgi:WD40 repeat protein